MWKALFTKRNYSSFSIQGLLISQFLKAIVATIIGTVLTFLGVSILLTELSPWREMIEKNVGFTFYSTAYFYILGALLGIGLLVALLTTIAFGFPLARYLKKSLERVADAAEAVSHGKLDYRLPTDCQHEIYHLHAQFNRMANRLENQVDSLQRLVNENAVLIEQAEQAASLEERRKLARELHDAVSQQLFAISLQISALPRLLDTNAAQAKANLGLIEEMVNHAQQELRALLLHLRPVFLDGQPLDDAILQLLSELSTNYPDLSFEADCTLPNPIKKGVEEQLFRVIQEAISNMLRHAKATRFVLSLHQQGERILLKMEDNGVGFDLTQVKKSSYGLHTMRERIEDIGGNFSLISLPSAGTRIDIKVPVQGNREERTDGQN